MKSNPTERMKDPFYASLLLRIEKMICQADDEAKSKGLELTDSQVRSAVIKAQKKVQGGKPGFTETTDRDRIRAKLIESLYQAPGDLMEQTTEDDGTTQERPLRVSDWVKALETVEDSVKTRRSNTPGSREYLDFVHEFIGRASQRLK